VVTAEAAKAATAAAMAPNPWERGKYNIPNDLAGDHFVQHFDANETYSFWAPITSMDKQSSGAQSADSELDTLAQEFSGAAGNSGSSPSSPDLAKTKEFFVKQMTKYLTRLHQGTDHLGTGGGGPQRGQDLHLAGARSQHGHRHSGCGAPCNRREAGRALA
jgi:hypothetical protein